MANSFWWCCVLKTAIVMLLIVIAAVQIYLLSMGKIDLADYQTFDDYGSLSVEQIDVMNAILLCGKNGDTAITHNISLAEFDEVIDHIGLYFGTTLKHMNVALWRDDYVEVNPELLRELEQDKAVLDAEIDRIVSEMCEGSDSFKLWQISNCIASAIAFSYSLDDIEPLSGVSGKGSCLTYSMLFYKMARRVGIQTYICVGYADNGERTALHAWNMVVLDGAQYFYDVSWYDNVVPDFRYVHSKTAWGRGYTVLPRI